MDSYQFMCINQNTRFLSAFSELSRFDDIDDYNTEETINTLQDNCDETTAF